MLILGRHRHDGRSRVVTCHGHHGNFAQTRFFSDIVTQLANSFPRLHPIRELVMVEAHRLQQRGLQLLRLLVHQARGGGDGVFADFSARQKVGKQVGHEEDAFGMLIGQAAFLGLGEHLENRVEIHRLDARQRVEFLARDLLKELLGNAFRIRVAIGAGQAEQCAVVPDAAKVDAPSVDADGIYRDVLLAQFGQAFQEVFVDAIDVPIVLPADFEGMVGESVDFLHREITFGEGAQNGPSAGGAAIEGEETMLF